MVSACEGQRHSASGDQSGESQGEEEDFEDGDFIMESDEQHDDQDEDLAEITSVTARQYVTPFSQGSKRC